MTIKEVTAWAGLIVQAIIAVWIFSDLVAGLDPDFTAADAAIRILWGIGAMIVLTIVLTIVGAIGVSIAQGHEVSDEATDERDRLIAMRSARNAYVATSLGVVAAVIALAMGVSPALAVFILFGAMMAGGATDSISQLIYYRVG